MGVHPVRQPTMIVSPRRDTAFEQKWSYEISERIKMEILRL